eukprot:g6252.t1
MVDRVIADLIAEFTGVKAFRLLHDHCLPVEYFFGPVDSMFHVGEDGGGYDWKYIAGHVIDHLRGDEVDCNGVRVVKGDQTGIIKDASAKIRNAIQEVVGVLRIDFVLGDHLFDSEKRHREWLGGQLHEAVCGGIGPWSTQRRLWAPVTKWLEGLNASATRLAALLLLKVGADASMKTRPAARRIALVVLLFAGDAPDAARQGPGRHLLLQQLPDLPRRRCVEAFLSDAVLFKMLTTAHKIVWPDVKWWTKMSEQSAIDAVLEFVRHFCAEPQKMLYPLPAGERFRALSEFVKRRQQDDGESRLFSCFWSKIWDEKLIDTICREDFLFGLVGGDARTRPFSCSCTMEELGYYMVKQNVQALREVVGDTNEWYSKRFLPVYHCVGGLVFPRTFVYDLPLPARKQWLDDFVSLYRCGKVVATPRACGIETICTCEFLLNREDAAVARQDAGAVYKVLQALDGAVLEMFTFAKREEVYRRDFVPLLEAVVACMFPSRYLHSFARLEDRFLWLKRTLLMDASTCCSAVNTETRKMLCGLIVSNIYNYSVNVSDTTGCDRGGQSAVWNLFYHLEAPPSRSSGAVPAPQPSDHPHPHLWIHEPQKENWDRVWKIWTQVRPHFPDADADAVERVLPLIRMFCGEPEKELYPLAEKQRFGALCEFLKMRKDDLHPCPSYLNCWHKALDAQVIDAVCCEKFIYGTTTKTAPGWFLKKVPLFKQVEELSDAIGTKTGDRDWFRKRFLPLYRFVGGLLVPHKFLYALPLSGRNKWLAELVVRCDKKVDAAACSGAEGASSANHQNRTTSSGEPQGWHPASEDIFRCLCNSVAFIYGTERDNEIKGEVVLSEQLTLLGERANHLMSMPFLSAAPDADAQRKLFASLLRTVRALVLPEEHLYPLSLSERLAFVDRFAAVKEVKSCHFFEDDVKACVCTMTFIRGLLVKKDAGARGEGGEHGYQSVTRSQLNLIDEKVASWLKTTGREKLYTDEFLPLVDTARDELRVRFAPDGRNEKSRQPQLSATDVETAMVRMLAPTNERLDRLQNAMEKLVQIMLTQQKMGSRQPGHPGEGVRPENENICTSSATPFVIVPRLDDLESRVHRLQAAGRRMNERRDNMKSQTRVYDISTPAEMSDSFRTNGADENSENNNTHEHADAFGKPSAGPAEYEFSLGNKAAFGRTPRTPKLDARSTRSAPGRLVDVDVLKAVQHQNDTGRSAPDTVRSEFIHVDEHALIMDGETTVSNADQLSTRDIKYPTEEDSSAGSEQDAAQEASLLLQREIDTQLGDDYQKAPVVQTEGRSSSDVNDQQCEETHNEHDTEAEDPDRDDDFPPTARSYNYLATPDTVRDGGNSSEHLDARTVYLTGFNKPVLRAEMKFVVQKVVDAMLEFHNDAHLDSAATSWCWAGDDGQVLDEKVESEFSVRWRTLRITVGETRADMDVEIVFVFAKKHFCVIYCPSISARRYVEGRLMDVSARKIQVDLTPWVAKLEGAVLAKLKSMSTATAAMSATPGSTGRKTTLTM